MDSKKEKLLKKTYNDYINLMLYDFPVERIGDLIADDVSGYGTTVDEKILEINRLKKIVTDQREQGAGIKMEIRITPIHRRVSPDDDTAIYMDECEISMVIDGAKNVIPLRLTSVFEFLENNWKLVHIHGSKAVETKEDTWHLDEWKKKNEELQKMVDQKTADLEKKNHELKIETALERVRTVAMSMQKPDDLLDVCRIISAQLVMLNVSNIRNVQVAIIDESKKLYSNYQFFTPYSKKVFEETAYENNPASLAMVAEMQKSVNSYFIGSIMGKDLAEFREWRNTYDQFPDPLLDKYSAVFYYFYSIGKGGLGLTTYQKISDENLKIFKRFHKVFTLAYRRFKDIQHALEQAREAQIEAALERVRARAMAMHKSKQLAETARVLFEQFNLLGKIPDRMSIGIVNEETRNFELWVTDQKGDTLDHPFLFRLDETTSVAKIYKAWKKKKDAIVVDLTGQELKDWLQFVKKEVNLPINSANIKGRRVQQAAFFSHGFLLLTSHEPVAEEIMKLLVRFAGVFDLTYTRFLDLQKAEAQAREAQIEAALERIRATMMAMHKSDELRIVVASLFKQLQSLGFKAAGCNVIIFHDDRSAEHWMTGYAHDIYPESYKIPYVDHPYFTDMFESWQKGVAFEEFIFEGKMKTEYGDWLLKNSDFKNLPDEFKEEMTSPEPHVISDAFNRYGMLETMGTEPLQQDKIVILKRFSKVFEQTYTRFLDLKKSEAQAREAQIEAALEKVRSRSIGMQKSEELKEVIQVIHDQLIHLNFKIDAAGFTMDYFQNNDWNIWIANKEQSLPTQIYIPYIDHPQFNYYKGAKEKSLDFFANTLSFEDKNSIFSYMFDFMGDYSQAEKDQVLNAPGLAISQAFLKNITLWIYNLDGNPYSKEDNAILMRFANVFEQTYVRFNDLQKAEAQAREAQIEAALERVRSRTMAMHNSDDMANTVVTLFEEVLKLGLDNDIRCGIGILEGTKRMETRSATLHPKGGVDLKIGMLDMTIHPLLKRIKKAWERGETHYVDQMSGKDVVKYYTALNNEPDYPFLRDLNTLPKIEYHNSFSFPEGILFAFSPNPMSDEAAMVLDRFANVFGQTYRRFRDLQKAEEQARESQIEAALERVRSKAMAMHSSEDLGLTVDTFFAELKGLNVSPHRCGLGIIDKETKIVNVQAIDTNGSKSIKKVVGNLKLSGHPVLDKIFENWELQKEYFPVLKGKEIMEYYNVMNPQVKFHEFADDEVQYGYYFYFKEGGVYAWTDSELPERDLQIFRRYSSVLSLTYRRYLDLKEAEAQAREARIEAALEKVRGQSMAMHKSEQLPETAKVLFEQFKSLGKIPDRIGIVVIKEEVNEVELWATDQIGSQLKDRFRGSLDGASSMVKIYKAWKKGKESIVIDLTGPELKDWIRYTREEMKLVVDDKNMKGRRVQQAAFFSHGFLIFTSNEPVADEIMKLLVRFAKVFDQAYIRFLDLQNAEAQAKEAIKQASLDRVRGQIASMRSTDDLQRITPLIWSELETLGVPFIRCGVFIIDESAENIQVFLTTPDGKPIGALNLPLDSNSIIINIVDYWKKKKVFTQHWNKEDFVNWMQSMIELGQVKSKKEYQGNVAPPESLDLNFIPFTQGMLYVGNNKPLSADKIDLVKSLAKAFSVAYARYEDFKQLEEAKNEIENTYNDLKATQNQLVHAEKMASLGELTAGIAHEIQNPLNFVNNFSEVNSELIEELKEEVDNKNLEEVKAIANDIAENEQKIHHHGKRADAIVKGMLQHSRTSTSEKETTDINELADEFLRLAYHGLRAKDKSFNADFKTELDENLPKIKVIPQDIGRVLLNLINNAFYAVSDKTKQNENEYKPTVIVSTKNLNDKIEIRVKDNGRGIPESVKDKIFQPFFTTKPTGQGTGLGLSMSYDIITKGHGGKLKVESNEGEGTDFIIYLPLKN